MMFFLVSVAGSSTYFGMKNLHPLEVAFVSQERFFATQSGAFVLSVANVSEYVLYDLEFKYQTQYKHLKRLEPNAKVLLWFETLVQTRGSEALDPLTLTSLFPLPHERKSRVFTLHGELLIYAKPEGRSLFDSLGVQQNERGDLGDFRDIERFSQGESLSKLHWASLAKNEQLMKKEFNYEEQSQTLRFEYEKLTGDKESRLSQLTLWVLECESHGMAFTLILGAKTLDSKVDGIDAILKQLALF